MMIIAQDDGKKRSEKETRNVNYWIIGMLENKQKQIARWKIEKRWFNRDKKRRMKHTYLSQIIFAFELGPHHHWI